MNLVLLCDDAYFDEQIAFAGIQVYMHSCLLVFSSFVTFYIYSGTPMARIPLEPLVGWLVVLGLTALRDNISVYIGPSPKEREKEEKG